MTARLRLAPVAASDLADVFRLYSSAEGWDHSPSARHSSEDESAAMIARIDDDWTR